MLALLSIPVVVALCTLAIRCTVNDIWIISTLNCHNPFSSLICGFKLQSE